MKINECAVIDIELLKSQVAVFKNNCEIFKEFNYHQAVTSGMRVINTIESIITESKPLEPIVRHAYLDGMSTDGDWVYCSNNYIKETEI